MSHCKHSVCNLLLSDHYGYILQILKEIFITTLEAYGRKQYTKGLFKVRRVNHLVVNTSLGRFSMHDNKTTLCVFLE